MKKLILFTITTLLLLFNCHDYNVDLTGYDICIVDNADIGLTDRVNLTFDRWNCLTEDQLTFFRDHISSLDTKQKIYEATILDLSSKSITSLEAGIFDNLTNLTFLYLYGNDLTSIPDGIFNNLTNLRDLRLDNNALTSIPDGIFNNLTNLTTLQLKLNPDTNTFTCNRTNYDNWGLPNPIPSTLNLRCN